MKKNLFLFFGVVLSFYVSAQPFQFSDLCDVLPETADIEPQADPIYYMNLHITNSGWLDGDYPGWCIDTENNIGPQLYENVDVYCSYDIIPDGIVDKPDNFDLVNWLLNQDFIGQASICNGNFTSSDVQYAIWTLLDDNPENGLGLNEWEPCRAAEIVTAAEDNGEDFEPVPGELFAVIFDPGANVQNVIIAVPFICPEDPEECAECDGGVTSLDLVYLGATTADSIEVYKDDVKDDKLFATFYNVNPGDVISFVGPDSDNKMGSKIRIVVDGDEDNYTEIHTSCSQAIYVGFEKGDFLVAAGTSKDGGAFCDDYSSECDGGLTSLQLEIIENFTGTKLLEIFNGDENDEILFSGYVKTGDDISFQGPADDDGEMDNDITLKLGDKLTEIHTSCSDLIYVGIEFDDRYRVVSGTSVKGGPLPDCGECEDEVTFLELEILADVSGATIRVYTGDVKTDKLFATFYNKGQGDFISFVGPGSDNKMGSKIFLTINSTSKDDAVEIHTSCSQDIFVGSTYGNAYEVVAGQSKDGLPLCPIYVPGLCICDECDGGVTSLDLQIVAALSDATIKVYKDDVKSDKLFATFVGVNQGNVISFVGPDSDNKMGSKIFLTILPDDNKDDAVEIHTSCSQDIYAGMTFGNTYLVRRGTSKDGGRLCSIDVPEGDDCAECKGGITSLDLALIQTGLSNVNVTVYNGDVGDEVIISGTYSTGDIISFVGPESEGGMDNNIYLTVNGDDDNAVNIHTSCSQDVFVGTIFGGVYEVTGGTSKDGGLLCAHDQTCDECQGGVTSLQLEIIGAYTDAVVKVYDGDVKPEDLFFTSEPVSKEDTVEFWGPGTDNKMSSNISITINDGDLTELHTSCSQPVYIGVELDDRYRIAGGTSKDGGFFCDCNECDGGITSLDLAILANVTNALVTVYNGDVGDDIIISEVVSMGDTISFVGPESDGRMDNNISLTFTVGGNEGTATEIHTSCSQDIYVGLSFDDRYLVTAGTSKDGGPLCEDPNKSSTVITQRDLSDVAVYPNPVTNSGTVAFVAANDGQATVEIYNILGKQVAVLFGADVKAGTQYNVPFSSANLMKGMYIVIVQNESATYQQKLSVVR